MQNLTLSDYLTEIYCKVSTTSFIKEKEAVLTSYLGRKALYRTGGETNSTLTLFYVSPYLLYAFNITGSFLTIRAACHANFYDVEIASTLNCLGWGPQIYDQDGSYFEVSETVKGPTHIAFILGGLCEATKSLATKDLISGVISKQNPSLAY